MAAHRMAHFHRPAKVPAPPRPPEYYQYFRKQGRRWSSVLLFICSLGSLYGIYAVFSKSWVWRPWIALLLVLLPWSLFTIVLQGRRPRITLETHLAVVQRRFGERSSVDVFLPICGESVVVLRNTFSHVARLTWGGPLSVWVLDDGADVSAREVAREFGFRYVSRHNRGEWKKSGNMNHGLARSSGEFIVVFDADFAPAPDFLTETVPYFKDPEVGIVQSSQYFDVGRKDTRNWMQQYAGVVQEMFYCWSQPARQTLDAAICVGTNVLYRRAALEKSGGFPRVHAGEDIITGIDLIAVGYRTVFVPLCLAKGVCPDTFAAAVNQQYRWCASSFSLLFPIRPQNTARRGFSACPMSKLRRAVFLSGQVFYTQAMLALVVSVLPSLVMIWCFPWQVGPGNYLPIAPSMLGMLAMPTLLRGWRPSLLRLTIIYSATYVIAAYDSVRGRTAAWVPSGSARQRRGVSARVAVLVRAWVVITQGLSWLGLGRDLPLYGFVAYWPAITLSAFQAIVLAPLLLPGFGTVAQISLLPGSVSSWMCGRTVRTVGVRLQPQNASFADDIPAGWAADQ